MGQHKVSGYYSIASFDRTPNMWLVFGLGDNQRTQTSWRYVYIRGWTTSLSRINCSTLNCEYSWEDRFVQLRNKQTCIPSDYKGRCVSNTIFVDVFKTGFGYARQVRNCVNIFGGSWSMWQPNWTTSTYFKRKKTRLLHSSVATHDVKMHINESFWLSFGGFWLQTVDSQTLVVANPKWCILCIFLPWVAMAESHRLVCNGTTCLLVIP